MNVADIETLIRRVIPAHEAAALLDGQSRPFYLAVARLFEVLSIRRRERTQATYLLPNATQTDPPATLGRRARLTVTMRAAGNLDRALKITPGACVLEGPSGRLYVNTDTIEWARRDTVTTKTARFECVVGGVVGSLDFLTDPTSSQPNRVSTDYVVLADQSRGRSNTNARIETYQGASAVRDDGRPATFESQDRGLYVEILDAPFSPGNNGRIMRIADYAWPGVEDPPGTNARPGYAVCDDAVRDYWLAARQDDGGVFTDYTPQLNDYTVNDVPLLPAAPVVGDAFYFAVPQLGIVVGQAVSLYLDISTPAVGDFKITWEVWNGGAWVAPADVRDDTNGFRASGNVTIGLGQSATTVDGVTGFWIRARVSAFTSLTTQPLAAYGFPRIYQPLIFDPGPVQWAVRDWKDLGIVLDEIQIERNGRNDDLFMQGDQRGLYLQRGESEDQFRKRIAQMPDSVSPNALTRAINRILAPLRLRGRVIDVGDEVLGFFDDVDFYDYYGPGDLFPENLWKLLLSLNEAYGWFYALLPLIAEGDYGIFFDEGPTLYLPDNGLYIGPCYDDGFLDGYSVPGSIAYQSIYEELRRRKLGGVGFVMLLDPSLNAP